MIYSCSGICLSPSVHPSSTIFNDLLLNHLANQAKFHVEPPWEGGTKVCINGAGHMMEIAATPIYGKNLPKYSPEPEVQ